MTGALAPVCWRQTTLSSRIVLYIGLRSIPGGVMVRPSSSSSLYYRVQNPVVNGDFVYEAMQASVTRTIYLRKLRDDPLLWIERAVQCWPSEIRRQTTG